MPTHIAIAFSQSPDAQEAAHQAAQDAKGKLNGHKADLVLLFVSPAYAGTETLDAIHAILQPQRLVGTSTTGLILAEEIFPRGIAILAIASDEISFSSSACAMPSDGDMRKAGFEFGRNLNAGFKGHQRQACLLFTAPVFLDNAQFIRGAQEVLGLGFPLIGTVGNNEVKPKKDHQIHQKQLLTQSAVGLLLGGANVKIGCQHGFKPLGKPRTITKADGNLIHTIDGKPAFRIYEEYLGPEADKVRNKTFSLHPFLYPLGIYTEEQGQYLLKNAVDILPDGSILCQGEIPEGAEVHLMIGGRDSCRKSAIDAAHQLKERLNGQQARLIIILESMARHKILKNNSFAVIQAVRDILGYTVPVIGMHSCGEISPLESGHGTNNTHVQNESIVILGIE